jgi:hypothetical protein
MGIYLSQVIEGVWSRSRIGIIHNEQRPESSVDYKTLQKAGEMHTRVLADCGILVQDMVQYLT